MKKFFLLLFLILLFAPAAFSESILPPIQTSTEEIGTLSLATLENIRVGSYPQKIRVVFDFEGVAYYKVNSKENELIILLPNATAGPDIGANVKVNDWVIKDIKVYADKNGLLIKMPLKYPVNYSITPQGSPSRLVIDFGRTFTQIKKTKLVEDGVSFYGVLKSNGDKFVTAQVLEVDPAKADIFPALAKPKKESKSILENVLKFFTPRGREERLGFSKASVSSIVDQYKAIAGINGTYFDVSGMPLGILMVNNDLISYPIYDRTSLVITKEHKAYIDNIIMDSYVQVGDVKYSITGINEPRDSKNDVILYTPYYGELTKTNATGLDLVVENGVVTSTRSGNTWIPEKGFVISAGALYAENMAQTIKAGDAVNVVVNIIPYSTQISGQLFHLVGGGPRLLKSGRIYISKYEEKFRRDISRGRAARTAVGITEDGKILFVTVDCKRHKKKNQSASIGMSLTELAYFMQSLGVEDALNLDGGGSSTMVVHGKVMNKPADGSQRRVSNAILIKPIVP